MHLSLLYLLLCFDVFTAAQNLISRCEISLKESLSQYVDLVNLQSSVNMPKSMSTLQNQISGCERSVKESLGQCAQLVGDKNWQFSFSLGDFVNDITKLNLDDSLKNMRMIQDLFKECEKIISIEKKRRVYVNELHSKFAEQQRKETVKRLTMRNSFKKRAEPYQIPPQSHSQEAIDEN